MPMSPHDRQRVCQRGIARAGPAEDTCDDSTQSRAGARSFVTGRFTQEVNLRVPRPEAVRVARW
jgi:hypothetical protein